MHQTETGVVHAKLELGLCTETVDVMGYNSTLALSDRLLLASGGVKSKNDKIVRLWRINEPLSASNLLQLQDLRIEDGAGPITLSPDGRRLALGTMGCGEVHVLTVDKDEDDPNNWNDVLLATNQSPHMAHCSQLAFNHDGKLLAAGWGTNQFSVFNVQTMAQVAAFGQGEAQMWDGVVLEFTPKSHANPMLMAGGMNTQVTLYQIAPLEPSERFSCKFLSPWLNTHDAPENVGEASAASIEPEPEPENAAKEKAEDGGDNVEDETTHGWLHYAAMSEEYVVLVRGRRVVVQHRANGAELCRIMAHGDVVSNSHMQPVVVSSTHLVFVVKSIEAVVHELPSGKQLYVITDTPNIGAVSLNPDSSLLAITSGTNPLAVHDLNTGKRIKLGCAKTQKEIETEGRSRFGDISFSPDGNLLSAGQYVIDVSKPKTTEIKIHTKLQRPGSGSPVQFDHSSERLVYQAPDGITCASALPKDDGKGMWLVSNSDGAVTRGFSPCDSALVLCAPNKADEVAWGKSRLSVIDVRDPPKNSNFEELETPWSAYLPLAFGKHFIPQSSVGWAQITGKQAPKVIHAAVGSELILVDTDQLRMALAHGALLPRQLMDLAFTCPQRAKELVCRLPHCVNLPDPDDGNTVLHICAENEDLDLLGRFLYGDAKYTPIANKAKETAFRVAIDNGNHEVAATLLKHLTPVLNEMTAVHMIKDLTLVASKLTTSMLVVPFLSVQALSTEMASFRTTLCRRTEGQQDEPIGCVLPVANLSGNQRQPCAPNVDQQAKHKSDQTLSIWRDAGVLPPLPDFDGSDLTSVTSDVVWLPGLMADPREPIPFPCDASSDGNDDDPSACGASAFHSIVQNCDSSVFQSDIMVCIVSCKWHHNIQKIVLAHMAVYGASLLLTTATMIASTQSVFNPKYSSDTSRQEAVSGVDRVWGSSVLQSGSPHVSIDTLQIIVMVSELVSLASEARGMWRKRLQHRFGTIWNLLDVLTSMSLLVAATLYLSCSMQAAETYGALGVANKWVGGDMQTMRTFGAFGVATKWFGGAPRSIVITPEHIMP